MKRRSRTVRLSHGDVRKLQIVHRPSCIAIVIYDDLIVPLIQAQLGETERQALIKALAEGE